MSPFIIHDFTGNGSTKNHIFQFFIKRLLDSSNFIIFRQFDPYFLGLKLECGIKDLLLILYPGFWGLPESSSLTSISSLFEILLDSDKIFMDYDSCMAVWLSV